MNDREWRSFATEGTRTAKVAITRADGRPHVTPVWFALDGDDLVFTTSGTGQKAKSLRRDPRAAVCVDEDRPPYAFVMLEGTVTLTDELDDLIKWATVLGGRYMGADRAEEFGVRNGVPGQIVVRLHIAKVIAQRDIAV
ncbi:PPOX class F420-dependent oxidoreductase [Sphaerisporangium perillae]|uniref:PPOX class F420-dependent oxidoreductase n=1 Tax=Sphaerisporangium perillae TaxID=2935860 RepID=UPI0027E0FF28|nr:PPOX class F420-dependent oxidoreductase [Sphaerisporangium perillae]